MAESTSTFGLPSINTFGTNPSATPSLGLDKMIANATSGNPVSTQSVADMVSSALTPAVAAKNTPSSGGTSSPVYQAASKPIKQEERLWTVRPRSTGRRDRGAISKMRILPLDKQAFLAASGTKTQPTNLFSEDQMQGWSEFFLTDVQCQMNEKVQVMEVFGDNHVAYYFGKSPTTFNLSGLIFDNLDSDWFTGFIETYENFLRGSKLAKNYALLEIMLPNIRIIGSVTSFSYNQNAARDTDILFSMQILAKAVDMIPLSIPSIDSSSLNSAINWPKAIGSLPKSALNSAKTYANLLSFIQLPISPTTDLLGMASQLGKMFNPVSTATGSGYIQDPGDGSSFAINNTGGPVSAALASFTGSANAAGQSLGGVMKDTATSLGSKLEGAVTYTPVYEDPETGLGVAATTTVDANKFKDFSSALMGSGDKITSSVSGAMPGLLSSGSDLFSKIGGSLGGTLGGNNKVLGGISSTLTGFKSGLFSPVFGFLSSITKIVTSVTGDISKVLMAFTSPVNSVLRSITGISNEVMSITNLLTSSVGQLMGIPRQTLNNITQTINSLRKTAGAISRLPINIADSFGALYKGGSISRGAIILKSSHGRRINPAVILSSGKAWTPSNSMTIPSMIRKLS